MKKRTGRLFDLDSNVIISLASAREDHASKENETLPAMHDSPGIPMSMLGFGVLMGWHFLVLYSPFVLASPEIPLDMLFYRQLTLNLSLALSFLFFALIGNRLIGRKPHYRVYFLILGAGLCSTGVLCAIFASTVVIVIPSIFMGLGEALIMLFWLHLYSETSANNTVRYLAASMIIGSVSCFLTRNLTYDISLFVTICLPLLSSFMLGWTWRHVRIRHKAQGERGIPDYKSSRRPFVTTTFHLVIYAFVFGLLQGSVTPAGEALLYVFNPVSILGAGVAGLGVFLLVSQNRLQTGVANVRQVSLLLFTGGLLLLPFLVGEATTVAATVILCAYILFDQVTLVQTVNLTRLFDLDSWLMLGINRVMVYLAFALGLLIGFPLMNAYAGNPIFSFSLTSAAVFLLVSTAPWLLRSKNTWVLVDREPAEVPLTAAADDPADAANEQLADNPTFIPWRKRCGAVAALYDLSPREVEVFFLVAKGRNAEYIQRTLFISTHTAKTHIANIYRKLEIHSLQELLDMIEGTQVP